MAARPSRARSVDRVPPHAALAEHWCVALIQGFSPLAGTLALVVWAWFLVTGDYWPQSLHLGAQAIGALVLAVCK